MASWIPQRSSGAPGAPASLPCRGAPPPGVRASREAPGLSRNPPGPGAPGPGHRRNVLSERERRKRISNCCEQLRALLPWFACRREDMASVLEMAVLFLRLAHTLVPAPGQHALQTLAPARAGEVRPHRWQPRALVPAEDMLSSGSSALRLVRPWEPLAAPSGLAEVLGGTSTPPGQQGPCEQGPGVTSSADEDPERSISKTPAGPLPEPPRPPWTPPLLRPAAQGWLGGVDTAELPVLDTRSVVGPEKEEGIAPLLAASPDWWPGSLEGRGGGLPAGLDRAEPCPVAEGGFQELQDILLEQWGPDLGCAGLALREEPDSLFPELFVCRPWGQGP
ncbi:spermatogenesis- and oogenesis-specific basic helix-loop-helix-containing protein 1 [Echinops telfairi]|uniref:Spermatogenesis- and oogenesis-specific basic helix-loop-helix-containing protein 1 n=1 Tax=Echinops telfairi TaxID=9371 RepID=A0AC55D0D4_ECHTE|nr:spermatogenesis- and oogenesis-specific basic helix-loop-helix-containing protein 1 [Echinops telfairi]